jgi:predicted PurR-regulated permease PerM
VAHLALSRVDGFSLRIDFGELSRVANFGLWIDMAYQVLARKYRSWTFDELVGQEAVATTLKNAIQCERIHHGFLFTGTRGVGKTSAARILAPAARLSAAASSVGRLESSDERSQEPQPVEVKDNHVAGSIFSWTGSMLAGIGETVALLFLLLASGGRFMQKLVEAMPTFRDKRHAVQISREIQQSISGYLFSLGLVNLTFGALVGLSLHLLGLPNAAMWGCLAACVNFIPYFGPIVGMLAVAMAGLLAFDTIGQGLLPAGAYFLLHLAEANLVTPFVLGHRCALNPVVIFVSLMFFGWLWGVAGALLAVPLLVTAKVVCDSIAVLSPLGKFLSG